MNSDFKDGLSSAADVNYNVTSSSSDLHRVESIESFSGSEDENESFNQFDKKNRSYSSARRFFNITASKNRVRMRKVQSVEEEDASKHFTLQFYTDNDVLIHQEKVAVQKGKSLKESIEPLLKSRGLSLDTHLVFLESSKTPLPLAFETTPLGGNTLHVKENGSMQLDERIVELMKPKDEKFQSQRQKKNIVSLMSNDDSAVGNKSSSLPMTSSKLARKGAISQNSKELSISLPDLLQQYSNSGFDLGSDTELAGDNETDDRVLEETWTDVIQEKEDMTKDEKIQQEAIWELMSTEKNYVGKIRVILQVFQKCLRSLKRKNYLVDVDEERLFANIHEVYSTNVEFWNKYLGQVVEETRRTKEPIKPSQLLDSFAKFEDLFDPYVKYCMEESHCVEYLKELKNKNDHFAEYLAWCENQRQCHRLKLADLLVKPMQRVTKYALLLRAVLTRTADYDQILSLENMISQVGRFVTKINTTLRLRHEQQKLNAVLDRIESYIPVDAHNEEIDKIILEYCNLDLSQKIPGLPMEEQRCILLDGSMRMMEKQGRFEVHVFLFTDVLLITKPKKGEKFRVIRPPYRLNKVFIHPSTKDIGSFVLVYLNEYGVLVSAFTLQVNTSEFTRWTQAIKKAKKRYLNARSGNGTTLDFEDFDDDYDADLQTALNPNRYTPNISPVPDRRTINGSLEDTSDSLHPNNSSEEFKISHLRSSSTSNFSEVLREHEQINDPASDNTTVKRSFSDPKSSVHQRTKERQSKQTKSRPISMIQTSDRDSLSSWGVLSNDKRKRSGSIPSDISDDSRRSSGIGDSFRSINSDVGAMNKSCSSSEFSHVQKLKARFENGEYQSDSSSSLASNGVTDTTSQISFTVPTTTIQTTPTQISVHVPRVNSQKKLNSLEYTEHHCIIHEEEEQKVQKQDPGDEQQIPVSSDNEDEDYFPENEEELRPRRNFSHQSRFRLKDVLQRQKADCSVQTDLNPCQDICIQCSIAESDSMKSYSNAETQYEQCTTNKNEDDIEMLQCHKAVQCDIELKNILTRSVSSQCGDFIHLRGACENETNDSDGDVTDTNTSSNSPEHLSSTSVSEDILSSSEQNESLQNTRPSTMTKSHSEASLPNFKVESQDTPILHNRQQSDNSKQMTKSISYSATSNEYPGMRALMNLPELLECSYLPSSLTAKSGASDSGGNGQTNDKSVTNTGSQNTSSSSPENTPTSHVSEERNTDSSTSSTSNSTSPSASSSNSKRFTWHNFDSVAALEKIQSTKYGHKTTESVSNITSVAEEDEQPSPLTKSFSKSSEQLQQKKQKSFKKTFLKKFSDSKIIDKDESDCEGRTKKQAKEEKKEEKKRVKMEKKREKEEKKREKLSKRRSSSHSSLSSSSNQSNYHVQPTQKQQ